MPQNPTTTDPSQEAADVSPKPEAATELPKARTPLPVIIGGILVLGIIAAVGFFVFGPNKSPETGEKPVEQTARLTNPQTTIIADGTSATAANGIVSVPIRIETGNMVSAVELHVGFDPAVFSGVTLEEGDFFTESTVLQQEVDSAAGTATFIIGTRSPKQGSGTIAVFTGTLTGSTGGQTTIRLLDTTQAAAIGEEGNVVARVEDGTVILK